MVLGDGLCILILVSLVIHCCLLRPFGEQLDGVIVSQSQPLPDPLRQVSYELESFSGTGRHLEEVLLKPSEVMRKQHAPDRFDFAIRGLKAVIPKKVQSFSSIRESIAALEAKRQQQQAAKELQTQEEEMSELQSRSSLVDEQAASTLRPGRGRGNPTSKPKARAALDSLAMRPPPAKRQRLTQTSTPPGRTLSVAAPSVIQMGAAASAVGMLEISMDPPDSGSSRTGGPADEFDPQRILAGWNCTRQLQKVFFSE